MYFYSSGEASRKWENLKKRYSKKKVALKQKLSCSSGASFGEVEEYFAEVKQYKFLSWLDQFTTKKKSKTNFSEDEYNDDDKSDKENQETITSEENTTSTDTPAANTTSSDTPAANTTASNTPAASDGTAPKTPRAPPAKKLCNDQTTKEQKKENDTLLSSRTKAKRDTAETFAWNSIGRLTPERIEKSRAKQSKSKS